MPWENLTRIVMQCSVEAFLTLLSELSQGYLGRVRYARMSLARLHYAVGKLDTGSDAVLS